MMAECRWTRFASRAGRQYGSTCAPDVSVRLLAVPIIRDHALKLEIVRSDFGGGHRSKSGVTHCQLVRRAHAPLAHTALLGVLSALGREALRESHVQLTIRGKNCVYSRSRCLTRHWANSKTSGARPPRCISRGKSRNWHFSTILGFTSERAH